jgi:hypothetical protein
VTPTGLDQRTLDACLADARAAATEYDDALAWLEVAVQGPMEPIAAEVWAFESRQPAAWSPLTDYWEGAFPGDRPRIRAFAGHLKAAWRAATPERG